MRWTNLTNLGANLVEQLEGNFISSGNKARAVKNFVHIEKSAPVEAVGICVAVGDIEYALKSII